MNSCILIKLHCESNNTAYIYTHTKKGINDSYTCESAHSVSHKESIQRVSSLTNDTPLVCRATFISEKTVSRIMSSFRLYVLQIKSQSINQEDWTDLKILEQLDQVFLFYVHESLIKMLDAWQLLTDD